MNTIVKCTGKKLRAVIFDGGSPSPDVSRTPHIPHENINKSWKNQKQYSKLYRDRSQPQVTSVTDPVPSSTTADDNAPAYDGPDLTPVKFRRMNTFTARQNIIMAAPQHVPAKMILDSGESESGSNGSSPTYRECHPCPYKVHSVTPCSHHFKVSLDVKSFLPSSCLE